MTASAYVKQKTLRAFSTSSSSIITADDVEYFRSQILDNRPGSLYSRWDDDYDTNESILQDASIDWTRHYKSTTTSAVVLRPNTVQQVSEILQYCNQKGISVVPQAGKTGLVGGGVPMSENELVLQLQKLDRILDDTTDTSLDTSSIVKCQAGVILKNLQDYCEEKRHLLVPVDLGSKGTCQIGGNLATNAGGQYYARYKSLAANVVGLQVVLADGRIMDWNFQNANLKDNTGYKLQALMIGSEGTLGIITGVALACPPLPTSRQAAFVTCPTFVNVLAVLQMAKRQLGEILAAMEWMDASIWKLVGEMGNHKMPNFSTTDDETGAAGPYYILIETHGSNASHDLEKMEAFLEAVMDHQHVSDGVMAQDLQQVQEFWKIRESANPTVAQLGYTYKYDISLPVAQFVDWIQEMQRERLDRLDGGGGVVVNANWGHILDGNLHYNVTTIGKFEKDPQVMDCLEPYLFEAVLRRGGSISAEHGLGQAKNHLLDMVHEKETLHMMRSIKDLFDPKGILNPGKFLP
jgi:D-2-hydroxyglutarate dehydrogenase